MGRAFFGETPNNPQAERGVIVCILNSPRSIVKIADRLKPEHFYNEEYGETYASALALYAAKKLPTPRNLADELYRRGKVESDDHVSLVWKYTETDDFTFVPRIDDCAEIVIRTSTNRRLIYAAQQIMEQAYHEDENSLTNAEKAIAAIALDGDLREGASLNDAIGRYLISFDQRCQDAKDGKPVGIRTGFRSIDWLTGGFRPGTLNIVAARTSIGKTSLALNIGLNIAKRAIEDGNEVAVLSLEMLEDELVQRLLSMETHIDQALLRDGQTDASQQREVHEFGERLKPAKMTIYDNIYRLDEIRSSMRVLCTRRKIGLIIVDYLQLIDVTSSERNARPQQRYLELGEISKGLKRLAQELRVPILALSQLSRESEKFEEPELRHLSESGKLENDADLVGFISCDEENMKKRAQSIPYKLDFIVRKQRNGLIGRVELMFQPRLTRFTDTDRMEDDDE